MNRLPLTLWMWLLGCGWTGCSSTSKIPSASTLHPTEGRRRTLQWVAEREQWYRRRYAGDSAYLVLPGLIADRIRGQVEVCVERTQLKDNDPCEFTVVAESSDHAYEALVVAFATPSDIQRALQFIGVTPGKPPNPAVNRYWARGTRCTLSLEGPNVPRVRLESLLVDRRTGRTLPADGFLFTGSPEVPGLKTAGRRRLAADLYQPKAIVSLFNSPNAPFQVGYAASKSEVYQNTQINPNLSVPQNLLLSLILEPASGNGKNRSKDLRLKVEPSRNPADTFLTGATRINSLSVSLEEGKSRLNPRPDLLSALEALAQLDRTQHDWYLTVEWAGDLTLGDVRSVARILSAIDTAAGIRIEPPISGQIYYKAFTPDIDLLDRKNRLFHPWELILAPTREGQVGGSLLNLESKLENAPLGPEAGLGLRLTQSKVSGPRQLTQALRSAVTEARRKGTRAKPPVLMVFAPSTLRYSALTTFLLSALSETPTLHVYLDTVPSTVPLSSASKATVNLFAL